MIYMIEGYVYLLEEMGDKLRYKIGFTKNDPKIRLRSVKTGNSNPVRVLKQFKSKHYIKVERMIHKQLFKERRNLEWFELTDEQVFGFVDLCQNAHDTIEFLLKNNHYFRNK